MGKNKVGRPEKDKKRYRTYQVRKKHRQKPYRVFNAAGNKVFKVKKRITRVRTHDDYEWLIEKRARNPTLDREEEYVVARVSPEGEIEHPETTMRLKGKQELNEFMGKPINI